jgi:excisionase family DNA binding protein
METPKSDVLQPRASRSLARPSLLKTDEVAEILAISTRKLWVLTNRGDLPSVRIGRCVRYELRDLDAFVQRQKGRGPGWMRRSS